jgi:hypothetical protein
MGGRRRLNWLGPQGAGRGRPGCLGQATARPSS